MSPSWSASQNAKVVGLALKSRLSLWVLVLPSALRDQDTAGFPVALALLLDNQGEHGLGTGLELAHRERERPPVERDQGRERQPLFLIQPRDAHLLFIGAEHEDLRF